MYARSIRRHSRIVAQVAVVLSLVLAVAAPAAASPIVDGRLDPAEGYTLGRYVDFQVEKAVGTYTGGQLWTYQDPASGDVFVNFSQPLKLVDNTYGDNTIGWGKHVAPSGKNHNFNDLKGSDKAQFVFTDGLGSTVLDVTMDYISTSGAAPSGYDCLGVAGGDGGVDTGSAADVLQWGSSLDYNFNALGHVLTKDSPATDDDYTPNPSYSGWIFEVLYELRVDGDLFAANGFGEVSVPLVHDSPNKIGKNKVYPKLDGYIPEPATAVLLICGAVGLIARRRRRATQPARTDR